MIRASRRSFAAALVYDPQTMQAPAIAMSGSEALAREILRSARRRGVPIEVDDSLAKQLAQCPTERPIPEELYEEVAAVLAEYQEFS